MVPYNIEQALNKLNLLNKFVKTTSLELSTHQSGSLHFRPVHGGLYFQIGAGFKTLDWAEVYTIRLGRGFHQKFILGLDGRLYFTTGARVSSKL